MKNELYKLSAVDLLSMYKTKETNPLEVSLDIIKQLENKNSQFNAFVCFDKEKILHFLENSWGKSYPRDESFGAGRTAEKFLKILNSPAFWENDIQKIFNE